MNITSLILRRRYPVPVTLDDLYRRSARQSVSRCCSGTVPTSVLVLGWCGAGVWLAALNYRAARKVVSISARRKAEIVITEVKSC